MSLLDDLRRMTAVSDSQYEIDGRAYWTDEDLEGILQGRVAEQLVQTRIELIPSFNSESKLVFLNGVVRFAGRLDVESASVVGFTGKPIPGTATIHDDGRITFSESQATSVPLFTGLTYDLNGAAADVLTDWASAVKLGYDITAEGEILTRSQRHAQLLAQAQAFRSRAVIGSVKMSRGDTAIAGSGRNTTKELLESFKHLGVNS